MKLRGPTHVMFLECLGSLFLQRAYSSSFGVDNTGDTHEQMHEESGVSRPGPRGCRWPAFAGSEYKHKGRPPLSDLKRSGCQHMIGPPHGLNVHIPRARKAWLSLELSHVRAGAVRSYRQPDGHSTARTVLYAKANRK